MRTSFGSDNHSGVHPLVLKAIEEANDDYQLSYGEDEYSEQVSGPFRIFVFSIGETNIRNGPLTCSEVFSVSKPVFFLFSTAPGQMFFAFKRLHNLIIP